MISSNLADYLKIVPVTAITSGQYTPLQNKNAVIVPPDIVDYKFLAAINGFALGSVHVMVSLYNDNGSYTAYATNFGSAAVTASIIVYLLYAKVRPSI